jgi:hypothetical protein
VRFGNYLLFLLCARALSLHAAAPAPEPSPAKDKAAAIIIPRIDLVDARIGETLQFLSLKSRQLDSGDATGVNLVLRSADGVHERRVMVALQNKSLLEIVQTLANLTNCVMRPERAALVLQPKDYKAEVRKWTDEDDEARATEQRLALIRVNHVSVEDFPKTFAVLSGAAAEAITPMPLHSRVPPELAKELEVWMSLSNVSLADALRYLCESADLRMRISRHGVDLFPNRPSMDARIREWWKKTQPTPPVLATPADVEMFLRRNGETGTNFAAAYAVTQDAQWLERGRALHPDNPDLLFFACAIENRPAELRALVARAQKAAPESMPPWLFEAKAALEDGGAQDGLRAFRSALAKPQLGLALESLVPEETQLLMEAGEEPAEAECTALTGTNVFAWQMAMQLLRKLKGLTLAADERAALGRDIITLSKRYEKAGLGRLLMGELVMLAIERTGLDMLPQDEPVPELGITPPGRVNQIEKRRDAIGELLKRCRESDNSPDDKNPAGIREYLRRVRMEGEEKALLWSLEQNAAAKK